MSKYVTLNLLLPESEHAAIKEQANLCQIEEGTVISAWCAKALEDQEPLREAIPTLQASRLSPINPKQE